MTILTAHLPALVVSYLIGAIPFGYLVAKANGTDIRRVGSGNIGATNVFRCVGKGWGLLTFMCDFLKGLLPTLLLPAALVRLAPETDREVLSLLCACSAVVGHNYPVFLRFKGGKGVATSAGAVLGVAWYAVLAGAVAWSVALILTRYVSLASILAAVVLVCAAWFFRDPGSTLVPAALTILGVLAVYRHKANIKRLMAGTENRVNLRRKGGP